MKLTRSWTTVLATIALTTATLPLLAGCAAANEPEPTATPEPIETITAASIVGTWDAQITVASTSDENGAFPTDRVLDLVLVLGEADCDRKGECTGTIELGASVDDTAKLTSEYSIFGSEVSFEFPETLDCVDASGDVIVAGGLDALTDFSLSVLDSEDVDGVDTALSLSGSAHYETESTNENIALGCSDEPLNVEFDAVVLPTEQ